MKDLLAKSVHNDLLLEALVRVISFAVQMLVLYIIWRILKTGIEKYKTRSASAHGNTIAGILNSILKYVSYFFILISGLETLFKINVMSVLAAAGVAGIAVAFGAQSVVKDVITGFFIIFEGKFQVGDIVTIDSFTGTVESITLRCTTLKNYMGDVYIVPNGSVEKVINHNKEGRFLSFEVSIAYESDVELAERVIKECGEKAMTEVEEIIGEPQILGVVALGESGVRLRALIPCAPGGQYAAEREMLKRVKKAFEESGVEIPYNRLIVINK